MRTSTIVETDSLQAKKMQASPSQGLDTQAFVRMIVERASTPFERLEPEFEQGQTTDAMSMATYMNYWAQVLSSDGKPEKLHRFFEFAQLSDTDVKQMLAPGKLKGDADLPIWTNILAEVLQAGFEPIEGPSPIDPKHPVTFEDIYLPFLKVFRKKIKEASGSSYSGLTEEGHMEIERFLLKQIAGTVGPCLFPDFQQYLKNCLGESGIAGKDSALADNHYYQLFISQLQKDNLQNFLLQYPVLTRIIANMVHQFIEAFTRFLLRLEQDKRDIISTFHLDADPGRVARVGLGVSDPHKGGEGVIILTFENDWKLVYKPRSMDMGLAYNELITWFNERLEPQLKILTILAGEDYGWIEFAPHDACEDEAAVERYYERAGMLLGITYLLDSTDFHAENMIATGEHPLLIDHETLLQPQFIMQQKKVDDEKLNVDSVIRSAMLPVSWKSANIPNDSMSGLGSIKETKTPIWVQEVTDKNTDRMAVARKIGEHEIISNLPKCSGETKRLPQYQQSFEAGFQKLYDFLIQERAVLLGPDSPLHHFNNMEVRFLFRMTNVYATILNNLLKPQYLKDANYYGIRLELLARAFITSDTPPAFWPILIEERTSMLNRDVPFYLVNSNEDSLLIANKYVVSSYFLSSCLEYIQGKLERMGAEDFKKQQDLIRKSISGGFNE